MWGFPFFSGNCNLTYIHAHAVHLRKDCPSKAHVSSFWKRRYKGTSDGTRIMFSLLKSETTKVLSFSVSWFVCIWCWDCENDLRTLSGPNTRLNREAGRAASGKEPVSWWHHRATWWRAPCFLQEPSPVQTSCYRRLYHFLTQKQNNNNKKCSLCFPTLEAGSILTAT